MSLTGGEDRPLFLRLFSEILLLLEIRYFQSQ